MNELHLKYTVSSSYQLCYEEEEFEEAFDETDEFVAEEVSLEGWPWLPSAFTLELASE